MYKTFTSKFKPKHFIIITHFKKMNNINKKKRLESLERLVHETVEHAVSQSRDQASAFCFLFFLIELFQENGFLVIQNFSFLAQTPRFWAGGAKPSQTPLLNGRPQDLIEAAKRGHLGFFFRRR